MYQAELKKSNVLTFVLLLEQFSNFKSVLALHHRVFPEIFWVVKVLRINPSNYNSSRRDKINLNFFYFHTSLWCLERFYEDLKGLHKIFCGTTKKYENKNLS